MAEELSELPSKYGDGELLKSGLHQTACSHRNEKLSYSESKRTGRSARVYLRRG